MILGTHNGKNFVIRKGYPSPAAAERGAWATGLGNAGMDVVGVAFGKAASEGESRAEMVVVGGKEEAT